MKAAMLAIIGVAMPAYDSHTVVAFILSISVCSTTLQQSGHCCSLSGRQNEASLPCFAMCTCLKYPQLSKSHISIGRAI